jgi:hypothetical protein
MSVKVAYTRLGVLDGIYQQILYDSATNFISITENVALSKTGQRTKTSTHALSQSQFRRRLSHVEYNKLIRSLADNRFHQLEGDFSPDPSGPQDYTLNVLSANMNNIVHTVIWSDASTDLAADLNPILGTIRDIASG